MVCSIRDTCSVLAACSIFVIILFSFSFSLIFVFVARILTHKTVLVGISYEKFINENNDLAYALRKEDSSVKIKYSSSVKIKYSHIQVRIFNLFGRFFI